MANETDIKQILDKELRLKFLGDNFEKINTNAIKLFQRLFIEKLHFNLAEGQLGEIGEQISTDDWNKAAEAENAYIIAEKDEFRVIYVVIKKLTRHRERNAISSLRREKWAINREYICIFFAENSSIWHMVCPYFSEGRTILRRYILGEGENHRTISINLTLMDASLTEPLFERVQEAFKVQTVTEDFYIKYKEIFEEIKNNIVNQKIEITKAKKFTHLLLNRLMFIYFIQKKGWINNDKKFMFNYLKKYKSSGDNNLFYNKWLYKLFFEAMNNPISKKSINDFDNDINNILNNIPFLNGGLFQIYDIDKLSSILSDNLLFMIIENFLEEYNFTITEESPIDLDIAIDPAMLGCIYESLIAEEERGKAGIFYTPRIEVDFMCRLGIYEYFLKDKNKILPKKNNIKNKLIKFIFKPLEEWNPESSKEFEFLRIALNKIIIVDPACGSGAFLVGMLNVIIELYMKLGVEPDYDLKETIIYNSLYGVDIKDWAIRMAEFRLWLALIESEEKIPNKKPILPNFSFKLQCGDSIIQKIEKYQISLRNRRKQISPNLKESLKTIDELKKQFFDGKKELFEKIKEQQIKIIINDLEKEIEKDELEIKQNIQKDLIGNITSESKSLIEQNKIKIRENKELILKIKSKGITDVFLWDLNFPEIMLYGGFDIVIANPPYVRQEQIIDPKIDPEEIELLTENELKTLKSQYKNDLEEYVFLNYNLKTGKTCDLYVYFYFKSLELLNKNGVFVLISSNTWLDSNFGKILQEGLLKYSHLKLIINNNSKRSFEQADVNTIIAIGTKKDNIESLSNNLSFLTLNKAFEFFLNSKIMIDILTKNLNVFKEINIQDEIIYFFKSDDYKLLKVEELSLWKIGEGSIQSKLNNKNTKKVNYTAGDYKLYKWSKFLRAPEIYFKIIEKSRDKFNKLGNILIRGYTTGANEFFYLAIPGYENKYFLSKFDEETGKLNLYPKNEKIKRKFSTLIENSSEPIFSIEKEYWMRKFDKKLEKYFPLKLSKKNNEIYVPNYLIKTPKELDDLVILPDSLNYIVLHINGEKSQLLSGIKKYIKWGEFMRFNERPTCRTRRFWYDLGSKIRKKIVCIIDVDKTYKYAYNKFYFDLDARLYGLEFDDDYNDINFLFFKSNLYPLLMELEGRVGLGDGALDIKVCDYENLIIPKKEIANNLDKKKIELLIDKLIQKKYKNVSIFEIIGTDNPKEIRIDNINEEIIEIDKLIFEDILKLNAPEQMEIYEGIIQLVKDRLEKAKSV